MTTATGFDAIVGQQHPIKLLKTFIRSGTMPHALLFTGDAGVGKKMTATALAMACNCLTLKSALRHPPHPEAIDACGHLRPLQKNFRGPPSGRHSCRPLVVGYPNRPDQITASIPVIETQ
jgi:hypothetical protein